jgi:hypothetical protein
LISPGPRLDRVEKIDYRANLRQKFLALVHDGQKSIQTGCTGALAPCLLSSRSAGYAASSVSLVVTGTANVLMEQGALHGCGFRQRQLVQSLLQ